ncbi:MAG: thiol reductant ABC exporter subunit CydD [Candidatus Promineifilaceae bacterium]|nr:thiol reductant ABC exporter subunit CydD [Candidatus Promineifilaceae bacterium]
MFDRRLWLQARTNRTNLLLTIFFSGLAGVLTVVQARLLSDTVAQVFLQQATLADVDSRLLLLVAVIVGRSAFVWGADVSARYLASRVKAALRSTLFNHLLQLGPVHVLGERTGELTATVIEGIEALDAYFSEYLPQLVLAALAPLTILLLIFPTDLLSGLVLFLTAPLIPLFMILIGRAAEALTNRQWRTLQQMSAHFLDVLQGLTTLKRLGQSRAQTANIARVSEAFGQITLRVLRVAFLSALVLELLATLSVAIIAVEIGLRLLNNQLAFADALFILILAPEFYTPLRMLGARFHAGQAGIAAADRIFAILDTDPIVPEIQTGSEVASPRLRSAQIAIRLVDIHFAYQDGQRPALNGVSFRLESGQRVALVGPSGAGKSTLISLLLGFIRPQQGQIWINDRRLGDLDLHSWRAQIAWVPQAPYLFYDTVAANIALGRPGADKAAIQEAARQARADGFIRRLPQGYDTIIGEKGARLSRGQSQRLALARAFLLDAPLLILDEPTSNLDPETERQLEEATAALQANRTVLVIAHRLSTVASADHVVVLAGGRVVQQGRHKALAERKGLYRQLVGASSYQGLTGGAGAGGSR